MVIFSLIFYFFSFALGAILGSFLNTIIFRLFLPQKSLPKRSFCPWCKKRILWKDLIPILSFFLLKGKCRYCQKKISLQYPLVEFFSASLFLISALKFYPQNLPFLLFLWMIMPLFLIIFFSDLKNFIIPDKILILAFFLVLFWQIFYAFHEKSLKFFWISFLSAFASFFFFFLIFLISQGKWLGFGDVKLVFLLGFFLGFPKILISLFSAFILGGTIATGLLILKKKKLKSKIPFAPFLIGGAILATFFEKEILEFYFKILE